MHKPLHDDLALYSEVRAAAFNMMMDLKKGLIVPTHINVFGMVPEDRTIVTNIHYVGSQITFHGYLIPANGNPGKDFEITVADTVFQHYYDN